MILPEANNRPGNQPVPDSLTTTQLDAEAVRRVLAGDTEAYGEIMTRHSAMLRRVVTGLLGDSHAAEDVLQDVFLLAYQKLHTFRFQGSVRGWISRIAVREASGARSRLRKIWRRVVPLDTLEHRSEPRISALDRFELGEHLTQRLDKLPASERSALLLYAEGWSYPEISEAMDRPLGTVSTWIRRARLKLLAPDGKSLS